MSYAVLLNTHLPRKRVRGSLSSLVMITPYGIPQRSPLMAVHLLEGRTGNRLFMKVTPVRSTVSVSCTAPLSILPSTDLS